MERIVVGIGGAASSALAVEWTMARAATRTVSVELVTVVDPRVSDTLTARARLVVYREAFTSALPEVVVTVSAVEGAVPEALGLASVHADLLVIGSHRSRPVRSALRGSMASRIASSASCPTVLVPDDWSRESGTGPVLVGFEVEGNSDSALIFAAQEAASRGSELHLVHSWRLPPSSVGALKAIVVQRPQERPWHRRLLDQAARELAAAFPGLSIHQELSDSFPAVALQELGRNAAMIVVGTHGRGPVAGLILGSTSREVMRHSATPLCVVPVSEEPQVAVGERHAVGDRRLERIIRRHLASAASVGDGRVEVLVEEGRVRLTGSVASFSERLMCAEVAESVTGMGSVHNELHVRPFEEGWQLGPGAPVLAEHPPVQPW